MSFSHTRQICLSNTKYRGILLSAVLVHSSMPEAYIAMCNSLNKVHSYLAHPLFAPVQVGMRALVTSSASIRHLCVGCCS